MNYVRLRILLKLKRRNCWNERHTTIEHAWQGVPGHLKGEAKKDLASLIRQGLIIVKPDSYGMQISLNIDMKDEIEQELEILTG